MNKIKWKYCLDEREGKEVAEFLSNLNTYERSPSLTRELNKNYKIEFLKIEVQGKKALTLSEFLQSEKKDLYSFEESLTLISIHYAGLKHVVDVKKILIFNMIAIDAFLFRGNLIPFFEDKILDEIVFFSEKMRETHQYPISSKKHQILKYYFLSNSYDLIRLEEKKENVERFFKEFPDVSSEMLQSLNPSKATTQSRLSYSKESHFNAIRKLITVGAINKKNKEVYPSLIKTNQNESEVNLLMISEKIEFPFYKSLKEVPRINIIHFKEKLYVMPPAIVVSKHFITPYQLISKLPREEQGKEGSLLRYIIDTYDKDVVLVSGIEEYYGKSKNPLDDYLIQIGIKPTKNIKRLIWDTIDKNRYIDLTILSTLKYLSGIQNIDKLCNVLRDNQFAVFFNNYIDESHHPFLKRIPEELFLKILKTVVSKKEDGYYSNILFRDAISQYAEIDKTETIELIHKESKCLTSFHDIVSREYRMKKIPLINFKLKDKYDFIKVIEGSVVNGYTVKIVNNSHELIGWGSELNNCLASYVYPVETGQCVILGLMKNNKITYSVEINQKGQIIQFEAKNRIKSLDLSLTEQELRKEINNVGVFNKLLEDFFSLSSSDRFRFLDRIKDN